MNSDAEHLAGIDVALEFARPRQLRQHPHVHRSSTAAVSGTTGWTDRLGELQELCRERGGALFYASNYCLGVNLMFRLNRQLAAMIDRVGGYDAKIEEVHHTQKKDAPSGTAITLAEGVISSSHDKAAWVNYAPGIEHATNRVKLRRTPPADQIGNPLRARRRGPGHPHRDLRVGGRHAGTETHDQEPPVRWQWGQINSRRFLCSRQGV